jgi:hypothetical protein
MRVWCIQMLPKASEFGAHNIPRQMQTTNFLTLTIEEHGINNGLRLSYEK